jgi:hypothetical protein
MPNMLQKAADIHSGALQRSRDIFDAIKTPCLLPPYSFEYPHPTDVHFYDYTSLSISGVTHMAPIKLLRMQKGAREITQLCFSHHSLFAGGQEASATCAAIFALTSFGPFLLSHYSRMLFASTRKRIIMLLCSGDKQGPLAIGIFS